MWTNVIRERRRPQAGERALCERLPLLASAPAMPEHEVDWSALSDRALVILLAVELPLVYGATLDEVAARLGRGRHTVAKWRKELRAECEAALVHPPPSRALDLD
jgi:hypothetical protein